MFFVYVLPAIDCSCVNNSWMLLSRSKLCLPSVANCLGFSFISSLFMDWTTKYLKMLLSFSKAMDTVKSLQVLKKAM